MDTAQDHIPPLERGVKLLPTACEQQEFQELLVFTADDVSQYFYKCTYYSRTAAATTPIASALRQSHTLLTYY